MEISLILISIAIMAIIMYGSTYVIMSDYKYNPKRKFLKYVLKKPGKYMAQVEFLVTTLEILISGIVVEKYLMPLVVGLPLVFKNTTFLIIKYIAILIVTILTTYLVMILGRYIPKHLAVVTKNKKIGEFNIYIYAFIMYVFMPLTIFSEFLDTQIKKSIYVDKDDKTDEKIKEIANIEYDKGNITKLEKQVLLNLKDAFDFQVGTFCVKFDKVISVNTTYKFEDIKEKISLHSISRILYMDKSNTKVLGVIYAKDLLNKYEDIKSGKITIKRILRQPVISKVNESAYTLFNRMIKNNIHISLVKDTDGENYGIVTMEDIIEKLLGDIKDEYGN